MRFFLNFQWKIVEEYDTVKELILKGYELVPEAYRQKFRNLKQVTKRLSNLHKKSLNFY